VAAAAAVIVAGGHMDFLVAVVDILQQHLRLRPDKYSQL
jgi:hypothetical protein